MGNKCENRVRMRCRETGKGKYCKKRFTLKKSPDQYAKEIECPHCGSSRVRSDEDNRRKEVRLNNCSCSSYPFPHDKASLRFCKFNVLYVQNAAPTDAEKEAYEMIWLTRRTDFCSNQDPSPEEVAQFLIKKDLPPF